MIKAWACYGTWVMVAILVGAGRNTCAAAAAAAETGEAGKFSSLNYEVQFEAGADLRSWTVSPWVAASLPAGARLIKPLLLVPTQAHDGAGRNVLLPATRDVVDEKYMLRQERLSSWSSEIKTGMRIRVAGPCPAVLKDVKGELAAEIAGALLTKDVPIEAGKEFELAPGIMGRVVGTEPVEMYGRKGIRVKYSYVVPGKRTDVLAVQIAEIRLFDAKDQPVVIDLRSSGKETVGDAQSTIEGSVVVATDTGKSTPARIQFTVATGVTVTHLPIEVGEVDLHGIRGLVMAHGPVTLPQRAGPVAETTGSDGWGVELSGVKVGMHQMNLASGKTMGNQSAELQFTVRPPAGGRALKLVIIGFDGIHDEAGQDVQGMNWKVGPEAGLQDLTRNQQHVQWEMSGRQSITLNLGVIPQSLARMKGTAVVVAPATVKQHDLPLEAGASAELVKGVMVKITKVYPGNGKNGVSVAYEYDLDLTAAEASGPCFPRGWVMAEWVDDTGKTFPVGWPTTGQGFGFAEESTATPAGRHVKGNAKFAPPADWNGKIVALRAYGSEDIGLKRVAFEMKNVPVMAAPGMAPVE